MTNDESKNGGKDRVDPLVWHYERERRIKIGGSVQWEHTVENSNSAFNFKIRSNFAFVSNACYIDVLVPSTVPVEGVPSILDHVVENAERFATKSPFEMRFPIRNEGFLSFDKFPDHRMSTADCRFTGRVFFYTLFTFQDTDKKKLVELYQKNGLSLIIRDGTWINEVQRFIDRPTVFLGHDSADKDSLVRELAHLINGKEIQVWYDEISLKPGDRLRKSLDAGLEGADYFMPVVTENWMQNDRYAEYEFDAIMQKYITEKSVGIVPICVGVNPVRLKEKSRVLADFVAIVHPADGKVENLAHKIAHAVDPKIPNNGEPLPPIEQPSKEGLYAVGVTFGPKEGEQDSQSNSEQTVEDRQPKDS